MTPSLFQSVVTELGFQPISGLDNVDLIVAHELIVEADKAGAEALRRTGAKQERAGHVRETLERIISIMGADDLATMVPGAKGMVEGRPVILTTEFGGGDKPLHLAMNLKRPFPCKIHLYRESFVSKLGKLFGGQDIQVGNPELDPLIIIRGDQPETVQDHLGRSEVVEALVALYQERPETVVNQISVRCSLNYETATGASIHQAVELLAAAAAALEPSA